VRGRYERSENWRITNKIHHRSSLEEKREWKLHFCEMTMVMIVLSEGTALVVSSVFFLIMNANPSDPGTPAIPASQSLLNTGIMVIGELLVTETFIAYVSHKFKKRYPVDLAMCWKKSRRIASFGRYTWLRCWPLSVQWRGRRGGEGGGPHAKS